ncbi:MAG: hypothetical protein HC809_03520 [Gammaproteobacteria bacterium]|nr:hypothetical protein [Gammaproteobacteria bacterium]
MIEAFATPIDGEYVQRQARRDRRGQLLDGRWCVGAFEDDQLNLIPRLVQAEFRRGRGRTQGEQHDE